MPKTAREIFDETDATEIYAVAAEFGSTHYNPDNCPTPILDWIAIYAPDAIVERISEFSFIGINPIDLTHPDEPSTPVPEPVFHVSFTVEQRDAFLAAFHQFPLYTPEEPNQFVFLILQRGTFIVHTRLTDTQIDDMLSDNCLRVSA